MKAIFIRHAESESNAGVATIEPISIGLTEKGRLDAIDFACQVNFPPDLIIVTPYIRTSQTAMPLISKFSSLKVETWPLDEFTYLSPSVFRNTTSAERAPLVTQYWEKCDLYFVHGPGAESYEQFSVRIMTAIKKLRRQKTTYVFTHGQVIRFLKQYFEQGILSPSLSMKMFKDQTLHFPIPNLHVLEFNVDNN
jgi:broad specificity phosphatase PhoE